MGWTQKATLRKRQRKQNEWRSPDHAGWTLMPQHEEISLLLFVGCFHRVDDPVNPFLCCRKIITTGRHLPDSYNKHTMTGAAWKTTWKKAFPSRQCFTRAVEEWQFERKQVLHLELNSMMFSQSIKSHALFTRLKVSQRFMVFWSKRADGNGLLIQFVLFKHWKEKLE